MMLRASHAVGPILFAIAAAGLVYGAWLPGYFPLYVASAYAMAAIQLWMWKVDALSVPSILVLAAVVRIMALPTPPVLSDDVYRYLWDGYVLFSGVNPFAFTPNDPVFSSWHGTELFAHLNSQGVYTVYPPVSQGFFALSAAVSGGHPASWPVAYMCLKGLFTVVEFMGLWALSRCMPRRNLMLLALSPVLITAGALQGHTDILLVGFLGGAYLAWRRGHRLTAVGLVTGAGWIKLVPLLGLPFLARRRPLRSTGVVAIVSVLLWIPFAALYVVPHVAASLDLYVRYFEFNAGPYFAIKEWYMFRTGSDWSKQIGPALRQAMIVGTLLIYVVWLTMPNRIRFVARILRSAGASDSIRAESAREEGSDVEWRLAYIVMVLFLLSSTTIHPWYVVGILVLGTAVFQDRLPWHWWAFSVLSLGTYLLYWGGPYWTVVRIAWGTWLIVWLITRSRYWLDAVMAWRAVGKEGLMRPWLRTGVRTLDLGSAEGYVGQRVADKYKSHVSLMEVRGANRTNLDEVIYDGLVIPAPEDYYEEVILAHVLHHSEHAPTVMKEALRVCRGRVIVLESTYSTPLGHRLLRGLDLAANRLRSLGSMSDQEGAVHHRTESEWIGIARSAGADIEAMRIVRNPLHRQFLLVISRAM